MQNREKSAGPARSVAPLRSAAHRPTRLRRGSLVTRAPMIGLIGPIGCGKSTVAGFLAARGAVVVDADQLTRTLMAPGTPLAESVLAHFGEEYRAPDRSLDRKALGKLVFAEPERLAELESIVHPAVWGPLEASIREADSRNPTAIVLEAIKLVEAGHAGWCDDVWLVECAPEARLARLVGRGMSDADARQRVAAQEASLATWRAAATREIRNDGALAEVRQAVDVALDRLLATRKR
jgi:dephospho-CoA kinase